MTTAALPHFSASPSRARGATFARFDRALLIWVVFQIACQLALCFSVFNPIRTWVRISSFAVGIVFLLALPTRHLRHPVAFLGVMIVTIVTVEIAHPTTNTLLAGVASAVFYTAILSPLFWGTRLNVDARGFGILLLMIWSFHALSSAVGVLQVMVPGHFQTNISPIIISLGKGYLSQLYITTPSGARVLRPMGLTDSPGAAAVSGFYAAVLGIALLLNSKSKLSKMIFGLGITIAFVCLLLAQVRSILLITMVATAVLFVGIARGADIRRVSTLVLVVIVVAWGGVKVAVKIGGTHTVIGRLSTLVAANPADVYNNNRGHFLAQTVNELLPKYPMGAGLGRWGMMRVYFGRDNGVESQSIYSEVQWTGLLLDGGIPLILAYTAALVLVLGWAIRIARIARRTGMDSLYIWATMTAAYDIGMIALTFNSSPFTSQMGMEFWLLNAALFAAAMSRNPPVMRQRVA